MYIFSRHCTEIHLYNLGCRWAVMIYVVIIFFLLDVFSYDEDEMVLDPHLDKHLSHFGINITEMKKVK